MSNNKWPLAVERKNKAGTADGREATHKESTETTIQRQGHQEIKFSSSI